MRTHRLARGSAETPSLTRRNLLKLAGAAGVAAAMEPTFDLLGRTRALAGQAAGPTPGALWVIQTPVTLSTNATVAGVLIQPGGELAFDPASSVTLTTTKNVIVQGRLTMHPSSAQVVHRLSFSGVQETAFIGGGMEPIDSDIGLWVVDDGVLDLAGTPRTAWARATTSVGVGARSLMLDADAVGWQAGDEIVVTPTGSPRGDAAHYSRFERVTVTGVSGRTISFSPALQFNHPEVRTDSVMRAEVLNLTRNVQIQGAPTGRTHVFVASTTRQMISQTQIRYVGPRRDPSTMILGRYGLHFHDCEDGSRGSVVDSVVVRDTGNHAFVPHMSNGVTMRNCIAFNVQEDAYWWDVPDGTDDTVFDHCVAALVTVYARADGFYTLNGFTMGHGARNQCVGSVAVGVVGGKTASGFNWPSQAPSDGTAPGEWTFADCVSHNNRWNGIYVWQNTPSLGHVITGFTGYRNGNVGIKHGAYGNSYLYQDSRLVENSSAEIEILALCRDREGSTPPRFLRIDMDHGGGDWCLLTTDHLIADPWLPVLLQDCHFGGYRRAGVNVADRRQGGWFRFEDCRFDGNEFWVQGTVPATTRIDVVDDVHGSIRLRRADQPGTFVPAWNARSSPLT